MEGTKGFLKSSPDKSEPVVKCSIHDLPLTQILNEGDKAKYLCEMCSTSEEYRDKDVQSLKPMAKDLMNSLTKPIEDFKLSLKELNDQHPEKFKSQVIADGNRYFDQLEAALARVRKEKMKEMEEKLSQCGMWDISHKSKKYKQEVDIAQNFFTTTSEDFRSLNLAKIAKN